MLTKDMVFAVVMALSTGVSGWVWNSYLDITAQQAEHDKAIAVMEVKKADKELVVQMQQQLTTQTGIMEAQRVLQEQQFKMLRLMIQNGYKSN